MLLYIAIAAAVSICPGSPAAFAHAKVQVQVLAMANCSAVRSEMLARVNSAAWTDPHNNGTYAIESQSSPVGLAFSRVSGGACRGCYTDRLTFAFSEESAPAAQEGGRACVVTGCSESQGPSFIDYSTNYCNLRMLYCAAADGCAPSRHDFATMETAVTHSAGAQTDAAACLATVPTEGGGGQGAETAHTAEGTTGASGTAGASGTVSTSGAAGRPSASASASAYWYGLPATLLLRAGGVYLLRCLATVAAPLR